MTEHLLQLEELSAGYVQRGKAARPVVQPFSTNINPGTVTCLIGPNGAGKSTLLRTIAGMQKPLSGRVLIGGSDVQRLSAAERARRLSVVLTQKMEVGLFTGYALVALGRTPYTGWLGQLSDHDHQVVRRAIELVGAESLAERPVQHMSDGERQRIMIARALAQEPDLLILDEPTAFLDLPRRVECMLLLRDLARRTGCGVVLSTHDLDLALRCADQIWLLPYTGRIQVGLPEDLVLNGAFEAAFRSTTAGFDLLTGTFQPIARSSAQVVLAGAGAPYVWTKRALEREGYDVVDQPAPHLPTIHVESTGTPGWQVKQSNRCIDCDSLRAVLEALRQNQ
ncbi:MAG: ABC transporter ATP-binding protein [Chloroflexi bacterium]|uniref:ABC transporter ATP-binding protein n=1 Tax=Candidatus Flexifilum breve TaxID=3140694 RepID=UPI0031347CB4|nr:ABC transporter ATP-binding protein [Chloroflexota bacterium]